MSSCRVARFGLSGPVDFLSALVAGDTVTFVTLATLATVTSKKVCLLSLFDAQK